MNIIGGKRVDSPVLTRSLWPAVRVSGLLSLAAVLSTAVYLLLAESGIPLVWQLALMVGLLIPVAVASDSTICSRPFTERALVLGNSPIASKLIEEIQALRPRRYTVVGVTDHLGGPVARCAVGPRLELAKPSGVPTVASLSRFAQTIDELRPHRIVVALPERRGRLPVHVLVESRARGIAVEDAVEMYERLTRKVAIEALTPSLLLFSRTFRRSPLELRLRRVVSLGVAAVGLLVTAPLMCLIALAIKIDSPGPALFQQDRIGQGGKPFRLFKFRTMFDNRAISSRTVWERDHYACVTRVGRWLRRFRLDELPQFWNVLKGDMDLVGPRPEMACNVHAMTEEIPYYFLRHGIRPGITGWAQIKHRYSISLEDVTEKMRYDLYYIKHMSLWLDLRIILETVKIIVLGRGAA